MAIPSGSGTEVLKRSVVNNHTSGDYQPIDLSVTGIWTATVLSIIVLNNNSPEALELNVFVTSGGNDIYIVQSQTVATYNTFVFNDKFVMEDGDTLHLQRDTSAGQFDAVVSYILQDWT